MEDMHLSPGCARKCRGIWLDAVLAAESGQRRLALYSFAFYTDDVLWKNSLLFQNHSATHCSVWYLMLTELIAAFLLIFADFIFVSLLCSDFLFFFFFPAFFLSFSGDLLIVDVLIFTLYYPFSQHFPRYSLSSRAAELSFWIPLTKPEQIF